jgi:hypothetical protein
MVERVMFEIPGNAQPHILANTEFGRRRHDFVAPDTGGQPRRIRLVRLGNTYLEEVRHEIWRGADRTAARRRGGSASTRPRRHHPRGQGGALSSTSPASWSAKCRRLRVDLMRQFRTHGRPAPPYIRR